MEKEIDFFRVSVFLADYKHGGQSGLQRNMADGGQLLLTAAEDYGKLSEMMTETMTGLQVPDCFVSVTGSGFQDGH